MAREYIQADAQLHLPAIRKIGWSDITQSISEGIGDFRAKSSHIPFLIVIYPLVTLFAALVVFKYQYMPLAFPVITGSLLVGPVITLGLYELSRKREHGIDISGPDAFNFFSSPAIRDVIFLGLMLVVLFFFWLATAMTIFSLTLGDPWAFAPPTSWGEFIRQVFTTPEGLTLIVVGNIIGLMFAVAVLCVSVVSFPMLLDRNVSLDVAIHTSVRAVAANPVMMAVWGLIIVGSLFLGALPLLVGLAVVVPVLGHATWHLYRKLVAS